MIARSLKFFTLFALWAGAFFVSVAAIAGLLAFVVWPLDVFNHFQPILFTLTLIMFVGLAIFAKTQPYRGFVISIIATGFVASSLVIVPEVVGGYVNQRPDRVEGETMRLMTYNIYAKNHDFDAIYAAVEKEQPDFLLLQEYWKDHRQGLSPRLEELLPYFVYCQGGKRSFLGIYSRFPIEPIEGNDCKTAISAEQRHSIIAVKVQAEIPFSLVTTHFDWPIPAERQYTQMDKVASALNGIDGPLVVAGDFNSTPFSYAFKNFATKSDLKRATWMIPTWPAPPTYPLPMPPWLQLDHIMTRGNIDTTAPWRGENGLSDHFPLIVDFKINAESVSD